MVKPHHTDPKGILKGEMFLFFRRNIYCILRKHFITSNFLTGVLKFIVHNYNKYLSSNFSSQVWK